MSTSKHVDQICVVLILAILAGVLALFVLAGGSAGRGGVEKAYESGLFDTTKVHTLEITMEDWEGFLETCEDEEYAMCTVTIDGETVREVGIRAKGNTSLSQVKQYGNNRYSFKLEFDHYQEGLTYQGLDKLSLNNLIQDNTYLKDYLTYQLMDGFGVDAPLCSYSYLTVNGEDWGLYLAVEGVEESFLERNYGSGGGELYKPDSMDMGGGRGAGGAFELPEDFDFAAARPQEGQPEEPEDRTAGASPAEGQKRERAQTGQAAPDGQGERPEGTEAFGHGGGGMNADDVKLLYTDDDYDSYANIFDNAKTEITDQDKNRLIQSLKTLNQGEEIEKVVEVEEVLRYFVVHNFVCNFDSYTGSLVHNYYLYEEDGVLSMIPWDYNLAFGGFQMDGDATGMVNYPIDTPVSGGSVEDRPMLAWIFADESCTQRYHALFDQFIAETFESGAFQAELDRVVELIAPYVEKDPTKFCTYEEFTAGTAALEDFCLLRAQSVRGQLEGTIPATSDGQQADSSSLVDATSVTLSDMGAMGGGGMPAMGPGGQGFGRPGENPGAGEETEEAQGENTPPSGQQPAGPGGGGAPPGRREAGGASPEGENNLPEPLPGIDKGAGIG